jgi:hypothetical protein
MKDAQQHGGILKSPRQKPFVRWNTIILNLLCGVCLQQVPAVQAQEPQVTPSTAQPESAAVIDGKKAGVVLGKNAFDRGDLSTGRVVSVSPKDWVRDSRGLIR